MPVLRRYCSQVAPILLTRLSLLTERVREISLLWTGARVRKHLFGTLPLAGQHERQKSDGPEIAKKHGK